MATAIRMRRGGRTHKPYYRLVITDSRERNRGPEIDTIGIYHPCARPEPLAEVDMQKALEWLRKGAQPSDTAKNLLSKLGVMKHYHDGTTPEETIGKVLGDIVVDKGFNEAPEPKEEPKEEPKAEAPAQEAAEAPAEEAAETKEKAE